MKTNGNASNTNELHPSNLPDFDVENENLHSVVHENIHALSPMLPMILYFSAFGKHCILNELQSYFRNSSYKSTTPWNLVVFTENKNK